jgi:two-component system nitrate/nitrite response regulator NarP
MQVAFQIARGLRNKQIADALGVSEATVKMHLHHIYDKLHLSGRTALALATHVQGNGLPSASADRCCDPSVEARPE